MEIDLIKDLTDRTTPHTSRKFRIDDDVFECASKLPAGVVKDLAQMRRLSQAAETAKKVNDADRSETLTEQATTTFFGLLDMILLPDSGLRFASRMRDPANPIDMPDIDRFMRWAVEAYGDRPTTPSSDSAPLPTNNGLNSTDGVLPEPSTPAGLL